MPPPAPDPAAIAPAWEAVPAPAAPADAGRGIGMLGPVVATAVLFGVSGGMLWKLGYNYDGLTGSPLTKIHPFTYLVVALTLWRAIAVGNPVAYAAHAAARRPAAALMAVVGAALLVITIARQGPGMAGVIDSFIGPALFALLLSDAGPRLMVRLETTLHLFMTANALLALFEFVSKALVFPYRFDGEAFEWDLRSTALQGHPLVNASLTSCYALALMTGARGLPAGLRLPMIGLQCAALVTFGGRSAMVVTLVLGSGYLLVASVRAMGQRQVPLLGAAVAVVLMAMVPVVVAVLAAGGFFDALLLRFVSDGGSANARAEMFTLFQHIPLGDLLVGPDVGLVESLRRIYGLEWGIENPILRMALYQGIFVMVVVLTTYVLFLREMTADAPRFPWLPFIGILILLNTSESISSKTTQTAKFLIILATLYRPRGSGFMAG